MKKTYNILFFVFLFVTQFSFAQYTDIINSNRPGKSVSAFAVGKTVFQIESGIYGKNEEHSLLNYNAPGFGTDLSIRYGAFLEQLELSIDLQYQQDYFSAPLVDETRNGLRQSVLGAKYLIYDPFRKQDKKPNFYSWKANHQFKWRDLVPAVAVYTGLNVRFSNNPFTFESDPVISPKFMLVTQQHFGNKYVLVTNIIADKVLTDFPTYGYVATLTRGFNMRWSAFIENQGYMSDFYADNIIRTGAAYLIGQNTQIDASIGKNFKDTPDLINAAIGLSWRFDKNYEKVIYRVKSDKKESKKDSKKKKSKKDSKKIKTQEELDTF